MLLTEELLRSIIRFGEENEEHLSSNLYTLRQELEPTDIDRTIFEFISDIYDRAKSVPSISLLRQNFEDKQNPAALARLDAVTDSRSLSGPEFRYALDKHKERLIQDTVGELLVDASQMLVGSVRKGGQVYTGPDAAINHISHVLASLNTQLKRGSVEGSFRRDAAIVRRQYEAWRNNPGDTVGVLTGIDKIDVSHRGARNGELCLVMGFVSHLKTSFCLNWLYRGAIHFGRNVAIASLETPIDILRLLIYVMHSSHQKFADMGFQPLDYEKLTTAALSSDEEKLLDLVIEDMQNNSDYGEIFYKEPQDSLTVNEIQRWAESKHKTTPLDLMVVDYVGLVDAVKGASPLDSSANLNKAIRQAKMMAMTFGQGRGIPVVTPFQANREGLKDAEKNGGRYKLTALANANEAERSSDKIYYVYLDDVLRNSRELIVGNLKNRNGPVILEQFKVFADPSTRLIDNLDSAGAGVASLVEI